MQPPYQALASVGNRCVLAACGPRLLKTALQDEAVVSQWIAPDGDPRPESTQPPAENGPRPAKKQKTADPAPKPPNIIQLAVSESERYVVLVTDDKCVRVLEHEDGLVEISRRCMPKRPCAIQLLPGDEAILVGDKFGDVYSLPFVPSGPSAKELEPAASDATLSQPARSDIAFKPSANPLTVHSQRNLQALEAQKKQKNFTPRKDPLNFEHKLLLGHVSMLTDMKYLFDAEKEREYIITADRDEHIRVSRGPSQAHVIEGYCLGHSQFVSKICRLGSTEYLVSGGGDNWLGVWTWTTFKLVNQFPLVPHVRSHVPGFEDKEDLQLAVSGIWSTSINAARGMDLDPLVIVTCEKINALFLISLASLCDSTDDIYQNGAFRGVTVVLLDNPVLDLAVVGDTVIIALDSRKEGQVRLRAFDLRKDGSPHDPTAMITAEWHDDGKGYGSHLKPLNSFIGPENDVSDKELDELCYGVANLRKRGAQNGENGEDITETQEDPAD